VLRVLPAEHAAGASMLHLVCHGLASAGGAETSHLLLEDDRTLTVKEILGQANGRPAGSPGGVVVLAACQTDLTAADHDEALTLSTAFLAAGAVTAIGSRWSIPDNASAVLLFMFHHYLTTGAGAPADALRAAQLWMLDPHRKHPPSMPPELRQLRVPRHVFAWGALTHQGQ
jgi:CHAT domain-containing protein